MSCVESAATKQLAKMAGELQKLPGPLRLLTSVSLTGCRKTDQRRFDIVSFARNANVRNVIRQALLPRIVSRCDSKVEAVELFVYANADHCASVSENEIVSP